MSSLFTVQTPTGTDQNDGSPIATATTLVFSQAGKVSGIRFFAPVTVAGATFTVALYAITTDDNPVGTGTGTLLASASTSSATTATWNNVSFASPVDVNTSTAYRAVVHNDSNRYVFTVGVWTAAITNGFITGIEKNTNPVGIGNLINGAFDYNATLLYPNEESGTTNFFVDVLYTAEISLGRATETDTAGTITFTTSHDLGQATETDSARPITYRRIIKYLTTPTRREGMDTRNGLWRYYSWDVGITLLVSGVTVTQVQHPWQGDLDDYDYVYLGGHKHPLSMAEVTILTNAGYGAYITSEPE